MESLVHKTLEGLCCVSEAEWHSHELKEAEQRGDGRFVDVCWLDRDLVHTPMIAQVVHLCYKLRNTLHRCYFTE